MELNMESRIFDIDREKENYRIAFIGAGNMALSMAKGFLRNGFNPEKIWAVAPRDINLRNFAALSCQTTNYAEKVFANSNADHRTHFIVFICTKPKIPFETKNFWDFLQSPEYRNSTSKGASYNLISVMLGVSLKKLEFSIRDKVAQFYYVSRLMPNLGCEVNASPMVTTFCFAMTQEHKASLKNILSALGPVFDVTENVLDSSVGISGSALGFYCTFLQALADGAVADGISRDDALKMGAQTAVAMGKLVLDGKHPIMLRDSICSPGGSTIAGVQMLEEGKFSSVVMSAVKATCAKSKAANTKTSIDS